MRMACTWIKFEWPVTTHFQVAAFLKLNVVTSEVGACTYANVCSPLQHKAADHVGAVLSKGLHKALVIAPTKDQCRTVVLPVPWIIKKTTTTLSQSPCHSPHQGPVPHSCPASSLDSKETTTT